MQNKYFVNTLNLPEELRPGIQQIVTEYPLGLKKKLDAKEICFSRNIKLVEKGGLNVCKTAEKITVEYGTKIDAFRALGRLFGERDKGTLKSNFTEFPKFAMRGVMLESSRNGVMTIDNVKAFLSRFALMGINVVMLYTEDTFEVQGQPFWGYLRGRYTKSELCELDDYAYNFGIEMFPCIQTLGHLSQVLQWKEVYSDVTDTESILLVGEEKTYKLLEQVIAAASAPFRSKRIHIGMDEASELGTGEYRRRNSERCTFNIMNEHLTRVRKICDRIGLKPMLWSDMYFRSASKTNDYYDLDAKIPQSIIADVPNDVELVYWDYYHLDCDFYKKFIDLHRQFEREIIVACGAWNWNRFWSALPFAYSSIEPCIRACKSRNVQQIFITTWGDDGMENDIYSTLPAIQFFAELVYTDVINEKLLSDNFYGSCRANFEDYNTAAKLDSLPCLKNYTYNNSNVSKWLLWDDPLIGLCEPFKEGYSFRNHYAKLASVLEKAVERETGFKRLRFPAQIARVLAIKCDCRKELVAAYKDKNKEKLAELLEQRVKPLLIEVEKLWQVHRNMWLKTYKPFGMEVIEIRYGGLMTRLQSLMDRVRQYLKGDVSSIPEFETKLLKFQQASTDEFHSIGSYRRIATPGAIF